VAYEIDKSASARPPILLHQGISLREDEAAQDFGTSEWGQTPILRPLFLEIGQGSLQIILNGGGNLVLRPRFVNQPGFGRAMSTDDRLDGFQDIGINRSGRPHGGIGQRVQAEKRQLFVLGDKVLTYGYVFIWDCGTVQFQRSLMKARFLQVLAIERARNIHLPLISATR